jgi:hypothetical protein
MRYIKLLILFFIFSFDAVGQSPLCPSTSTNFGYERVNSITINGQSYTVNTGWSGPGYIDHTSTPVPTITANDTIQLDYQIQTTGSYNQFFKLWIDFNGNGDLTDVGELVHSSSSVVNGVQNFTNTFTVPDSVYNGEVYMRFIMVYSSSPTLCGNYSYGNTVDFKTDIVGAADSISADGYVKGAEEQGLAGVPVKLLIQPKGQPGFNYTEADSTLTDSIGYYQFDTNINYNNYDFTINIYPELDLPETTDIIWFTDRILTGPVSSKDYWRMDVNNSGEFSVSDIFLMHQMRQGNITSYPGFGQTLWNTNYWQQPYVWDAVKVDTDDKTLFPGYGQWSLFDLLNENQTTFYVIGAGHKN